MIKCRLCNKKFQPTYSSEDRCPKCEKFFLTLRKKLRRIWLIRPVTKVKESKKLYNRKKSKDKIRKEKEL